MDFCTNCVNEYAWRPTENPFPKECKECEVIDGKPSNFKPKSKTNADRIRAMTDEELAKVLNAFTAYFEECNRSSFDVECKDCELYELCCLGENKALEWLKQPAEE